MWFSICRRNPFLGMHIARNVVEFRDCIDNVGLVDMYRADPLFTLGLNKRVNGFIIAKKLDLIW